MKFRLE